MTEPVHDERDEMRRVLYLRLEKLVSEYSTIQLTYYCAGHVAARLLDEGWTNLTSERAHRERDDMLRALTLRLEKLVSDYSTKQLTYSAAGKVAAGLLDEGWTRPTPARHHQLWSFPG
jgi:hypothetical protein